jgi:hypothetical protein
MALKLFTLFMVLLVCCLVAAVRALPNIDDQTRRIVIVVFAVSIYTVFWAWVPFISIGG